MIPLSRMVCSQRSCAVLSHCFTDCLCARESAFFVSKLVARATNFRTIVLIANSIKICIIFLSLTRGTIPRRLLTLKLEMHMTFKNRLYSENRRIRANNLLHQPGLVLNLYGNRPLFGVTFWMPELASYSFHLFY